MPDTARGDTEPKNRWVTDLRENQILLSSEKKHDNEMISNDILLYP